MKDDIKHANELPFYYGTAWRLCLALAIIFSTYLVYETYILIRDILR